VRFNINIFTQLILLLGLLAAAADPDAARAVELQQRRAIPAGSAPAGDVLRPGHLGRTTGDLERIIHFYHDLLGTGIQGERHQDRPFWSSKGLIDFANSPRNAEFRAVILPIPGTTAETGKGTDMAIEAIEFRNIERHQYIQQLQDIGGSHLILILRNLDKTLGRLQAEGVPVITSGGKPVTVPAMPGVHGVKRAVMVRDPDGYPVELMEFSPAPATTAPAGSNIIGARVSITVADLEATEKLYQDLVGPDLQFWTSPAYIRDAAYNALRNTPGAEYRNGLALIPGSPVLLEFVQYRKIKQRHISPRLQDIDVAHLLFMAKDLDVIMPRIRAAGLHTLATSGEPVFIVPKVRALFVTDPNHFFIEFMQRVAQ
jgi:catechol 2,3-dioxygenase-like lactoylglutathione lyase family enzyme